MTHAARFAGSLAVLSLLLPSACSREPEAPAEPAAVETGAGASGTVELSPEAVASAGISTAVASRRALRTEIETTGSVDFDPNRLAHVTPSVPGRIEAVLADLGASVRRGQALARIDSVELGRAIGDYLQAKARAELARETFEREQRLFTDRVSSEQEMLTARAASREADAALRSAENQLHLLGLSDGQLATLAYDQPRASIHEVRSPFAGTVVERHVSLGEMVELDSQLFQVADLSSLWVWVDVFERDLARVHLEDEARIQVDSYPGKEFVGRIAYLANRVDADSRTARARVDVTNADGLLRPGMFARVRISDPHGSSSGDTAATALAVPEAAIQRDGEESVVFVEIAPGRYQRRAVVTGRAGEGFVEIVSGLEDGESVVVTGTFVLKSEASKDSLGEEE